MRPNKTAVLDAVAAGLADSVAGRIGYSPLSFVIEWQLGWQPAASKIKEEHAIYPSPEVVEIGTAPREVVRSLPPISRIVESRSAPKRPPPWYVGMSKEFAKQISGIDRKLQGRILEALTNLTSNPVQTRGDTVKPLTGDFQGCWRYRIGDYRLIYSPDKSTGDITLLAFAARGAAYD
jgi:mRNA-degrading endonuclease RelE of RelBE toxin-antitoxin system